jgi:hypothetical protein
MELYLQFGYGMMDHSRALVDAWGGGTVILSPRDLRPKQLGRLGEEIGALPGGSVLLDPQYYDPRADHERLTDHEYWPDGEYDTANFWLGPQLGELLKRLLATNNEVGAKEFILPGLLAPRVDDDWLAQQKQVALEAEGVVNGTMPLMSTVALSSDALRHDDDVHSILDVAHEWPTDGVYLVCEHPKGDYLVTDPSWLSNLLDLVAGLRLKKKRVVVGYSNHQMLALAACSTTAIASGTWMNVRSFPPDKFRAQYDDEVKQRTTWVYCPSALSEYKLPFLDIAQKTGVLDDLRPEPSRTTPQVDLLFTGPQPTSIGISEQAAFRHYLQCLRLQTRQATKASFDATADAHDALLDAAEALLLKLHAAGVRGQMRDFREAVDANRAALAVLRKNRGPMLRRKWAELA